ncbi:OmpA family protein [Sinirhodobacter sp. HNIBRBA609]|nr:OmpA family protein [Sinirhodobacter sp. HNIBRBA609]
MKRLRTTTALVAGLATLPPALGLAQSTPELDAAVCIAAKIGAGASEEEARTACLPSDPAPEAVAEEGAPAEEPAADAEPAEESAATEPAPEAEPAAEEPAPEAVVEEAAPAEEPAAEESVAAEPAMEEPAAEETASDPTPEPEAAQAPAEEPAPAETATEDAPAAEPAPAETAAEPASEPESAETAVAPEAEPSDANTLKKALAAQLEAMPAEEAQAVQQLEAAIEATESADTGAPVSNAALAAEETAPAAAEVIEEVITEQSARSSTEDFTSKIDTKPEAKKKKKDSGLSDAEKLAIVGLGALAVGAILNNGSEVAVNSGDRVVVQNPDGSYQVIKDDNALLRQPGSTMRTQSFADGSTRTVSTKADGTQIITVYDAQRRIVQRTRIDPDGSRYILVDDSVGADPVEVSTLPRYNLTEEASSDDALRAAIARETEIDRRFTLAQVRQIPAVRALAPAIAVRNITFATGSAAIRPEQARDLVALGDAIRARIADNPHEIFLIEGHTDAVGNAAYNLALSDRRAESLALALTEYFDVPAENLVVQGYGEQFLKVDTQVAEEANRRTTVRRITDLLRISAAN